MKGSDHWKIYCISWNFLLNGICMYDASKCAFYTWNRLCLLNYKSWGHICLQRNWSLPDIGRQTLALLLETLW